ncbi:MAG: Xaa-Pro peptidase family protein [Methanoregulaceae archaeon]|jgi:Xaa-Pro aminopeptidase|nr:Xaa-Pro peptidase family protein [Methanoregulaceae archaeon]
MQGKVPRSELRDRMNRFKALMDKDNPDWELSVIFGNINTYYFTGTMQDGVLLIPNDGEAEYWVRRSIDRARDESLFPDIRAMGSFRDAVKENGKVPEVVYLETEVVPVALFRRFQKYFPCSEARPLDAQVAKIRAVKSAYELSLMEKAGEIHRYVLEDYVPGILQEGMSEADFGSTVFSAMVREGHQGIVRFGRFNCEIVVGQLGFGESSIYPTCFDGPGGCYGMSPASPVLGSRNRLLKSGDLIFIDNACGFEGYQTDKTMTYMFGRSLPREAIAIHERCLSLQDEMAACLRPGTIPSEIYQSVMESVEPAFLENFMGFESRRARFLGHGVGLQVDEMPVIAPGFDEPLQEGMVIALEPKKGVRDVGMVGTENTYIVTSSGGRSITGNNRGLIPVY